MTATYITTSIPYVNAAPHIGHALEFVEADVLARARRLQGRAVRLQSGTDDHALKNVRAAAEAGVPVAEHVDGNAQRFLDLLAALDISVADVIRTSRDPRHRPGVARLWAACDAAGDLYEKEYEGLYCVGCEEFYDETELTGGLCPDHKVEPEWVRERNWFFRLTRYEATLRDLLTSGAYRIEPDAARREVAAFIERGLHDFSVSRSATRARGWGIPVPGDESQVVSVWYDALGNYVTALGYGSDDAALAWWTESGERLHIVGKDIVRFHAIYWPAILLSADLPLPTALFVHGFLTVGGTKIGKSLGNAVDPLTLVERFGVDALRWWLASELPLGTDADFTPERLVEKANQDLANGFGNLVGRITTLSRSAGAVVGDHVDSDSVALQAAAELGTKVTNHLDRFDLRRATQTLTSAVGAVNRELEATRPWEHPEHPASVVTIATGLAATRAIATWFQPFVPDLASRALARLDGAGAEGALFPRLRASRG